MTSRSSIASLAAALAIAGAADGSAAAQMYKCVENGRTVYQQQACNPQPPPEPAASAARAAANAASDAAAKKVKRPSPASSAPATRR